MSRFLNVLAVASNLAAFAGSGQAQEIPSAEAKKAWTGVYTDRIDLIEQAAAAGVELATIEHDGQNLVAIAAIRGSPAVLEYLAGRNVDINLKDSEGYTPVMRALEQGRVDNALKLRDLGASLEGVTDDGYTVRVLAEVAGLPDFGPEPAEQEVLLSPAAANDVLLKATEFGDITSVRLALENGADISAKASNGWTPLMIAALAGRADIVKLLIEKGALGSAGEPLDRVGNRVDAVVLALLGKGKGNLDAILTTILRDKDVSADNEYYRAVAARQGHYPQLIDHYFPANDLPPLEYILPHMRSNDRVSWERVQTTLQDLGLYRGEVDGVPGVGTFSAVVGYLKPFEELLVSRGLTAMLRAQNLQKTADGPSSRGYGAFDWGGEEVFGQIRVTKDNPVGAGYFGHRDNLDPTNVRFGYFDPAIAAEEPIVVFSQRVGTDSSNSRSLELRIAGGKIRIERDPAHTRAIFSPDAGQPTYFDFAETNAPLPVGPLPGADLMVEPLGSYSVIIDSTEREPDEYRQSVDDAGISDNSQPVNPMSQGK